MLKIILTVIIVLIILLGYVSTNPIIGGFFENIFDRFSGITVFEFDTAQRDVLFSLEVNRYDAMAVKTRRLVNMTIIPDNMSISLNYGDIKPTKALTIYNYYGYISVDENKINLDGRHEKFEFGDKSASFDSGTIRGGGTFLNLTIENLALNEIKLTNVTGRLDGNEVETIFADVDIDIKSPLGLFDFNEKLKITGSAEKITIPKRNLVIG